MTNLSAWCELLLTTFHSYFDTWHFSVTPFLTLWLVGTYVVNFSMTCPENWAGPSSFLSSTSCPPSPLPPPTTSFSSFPWCWGAGCYSVNKQSRVGGRQFTQRAEWQKLDINSLHEAWLTSRHLSLRIQRSAVWNWIFEKDLPDRTGCSCSYRCRGGFCLRERRGKEEKDLQRLRGDIYCRLIAQTTYAFSTSDPPPSPVAQTQICTPRAHFPQYPDSSPLEGGERLMAGCDKPECLCLGWGAGFVA